ncbi:GTP-binding protein ypt2 [Stylophora pistillata]|uniref:GTP-binding protein ypt2 n=2 Tax=Stylophora pistillata TaxID=50429 RepID=A0A2B4SS46_STYPI|nr:GTP-binding protein ypt2 [Stylophora pistillata]
MAATANIGTIFTRAPETYGKWCYSREHKNYGTKADIFSFGVVLLEVIVGHLSVRLSELRTEDGKIVPETIRRSEDLHEIQPEHPLRPLVLVCLEDEPEDRPTAENLVNTLTGFKDSNEQHRSQENLNSRKRVDRVTFGQYDYEFKVVLVGDLGVGKTSIGRKFVLPSRPFQDYMPTTIAGGEYNERLQLKGKSIFLQIVDTAGEFNNSSSLPQLYRGVHGAAVVFDVASKASLASVRQWVSMVREKCGNDIPIILVGNKIDCKRRQVSIETAEKMCQDFNLFYIEASAKTGLNIDETFSVLLEQLMEQRDQQDFSRPSRSSAPYRRSVDLRAKQYASVSQITEREPAVRRRINKDPDSLSLNSDINKERNHTTPLLVPEADRKKKSCCS